MIDDVISLDTFAYFLEKRSWYQHRLDSIQDWIGTPYTKVLIYVDQVYPIPVSAECVLIFFLLPLSVPEILGII